MYRTDAPNNAIAAPTPSALGAEEYFRDASATHGTLVDDDYLNALQESLIAVLDDQSFPHSKSDPTVLVSAIRSLVRDTLNGAPADDLRGFIAGLRTVITGTTTFEITPGVCRDRLNASNMELSGSNFALDTSVAWNTGTGSMASPLVFQDPIFIGRVFALGKPSPSREINFGIDTSPTGLGLLADAASSGFTTCRQIGWVTHHGAGLIDWIHDAGDTDFWRLKTPIPTTMNFYGSTSTDRSKAFEVIAPYEETTVYGILTIDIREYLPSGVQDHYLWFGDKNWDNPPSDNTISNSQQGGPPYRSTASADFYSIMTTDWHLTNTVGQGGQTLSGTRFRMAQVEATLVPSLPGKNFSSDLAALKFDTDSISQIFGNWFYFAYDGFRWNRNNPT